MILQLVESYPFVSQNLRDYASQQRGHHHTHDHDHDHDHDHEKHGKHHCSMAAFQEKGTGQLFSSIDSLPERENRIRRSPNPFKVLETHHPSDTTEFDVSSEGLSSGVGRK